MIASQKIKHRINSHLIQQFHFSVYTQKNWKQGLKHQFHSILHSSHKVEATQMSVDGQKDKQNVLYTSMEYHSPSKGMKFWYMLQHWRHDVTRNKPDTSRLSHFSCVWRFGTLWTVACKAPLSPWDSPGKKTGIDCHFLLHKQKDKHRMILLSVRPLEESDCCLTTISFVVQLCPTLLWPHGL